VSSHSLLDLAPGPLWLELYELVLIMFWIQIKASRDSIETFLLDAFAGKHYLM